MGLKGFVPFVQNKRETQEDKQNETSHKLNHFNTVKRSELYFSSAVEKTEFKMPIRRAKIKERV